MIADTLKRLRKRIFAETQTGFGVIAGVSQATVSKWEKGLSSPELDQLRRIRAEALRRGLSWNDSWFFDLPIAPEVA